MSPDELIEAAKRMRDAYAQCRRIDSFIKTCPTIEEFDRALAEYEQGKRDGVNSIRR